MRKPRWDDQYIIAGSDGITAFYIKTVLELSLSNSNSNTSKTFLESPDRDKFIRKQVDKSFSHVSDELKEEITAILIELMLGDAKREVKKITEEAFKIIRVEAFNTVLNQVVIEYNKMADNPKSGMQSINKYHTTSTSQFFYGIITILLNMLRGHWVEIDADRFKGVLYIIATRIVNIPDSSKETIFREIFKGIDDVFKEEGFFN
jgi:hypothetical protein